MCVCERETERERGREIREGWHLFQHSGLVKCNFEIKLFARREGGRVRERGEGRVGGGLFPNS